MISGGATCEGDAQVQAGVGLDSVGKYSPRTKREGGGYRGIVLVEVLWSFSSVVVNCLLKSSAVLNDTLHGFREGI